MVTTKAVGDEGEARALAHLQRAGLELVERNYRVGGGPHRRGAEVDLILREADGTLVFCEVRQRGDASRGGAAASVSALKRRRLVMAAHHFLMRYRVPPRCRFDVVAIDGPALTWLKAAFEADSA